MRDYGKIKPQLWTGETGRAIKAAGRDAQLMAVYLLSCPSSNMIGLYYLPLPVVCHELALSRQGASKALQGLSEVGFAMWDEAAEQVFVVEMAAHQIADDLKATDNRVKGIAKDWQAMNKSPFYLDFYRRYRDAFHLPAPALPKAPPKPLRSQEQEQEQDKNPIQDSANEPEGTSSEAQLVALAGGRR
jgi:hypothetical protein